jgi:PAS domain S-box-containing protein
MSATQEWKEPLRTALFEEIPCGIVVIDHSFTVVDHNRAFANIFGEAKGKPCYVATRGRTTPCTSCPAQETFADGQVRVLEQSGTDHQGHAAHYLVQLTPLGTGSGEVDFVAAIITDLTATKRLQREYQTLFEKVPCYVTVINRDYRVVKANEMFRSVFGEAGGQPCYELYKHRSQRCVECPTEQTFLDGEPHSASEVGVTREGKPAYFVVSTAPLLRSDGEVSHVIEMAIDVTGVHKLEEELERANILREALVEHAPYAILVLDGSRRVVLVNAACEHLLGRSRQVLLGGRLSKAEIGPTLDRLLRRAPEEGAIEEISVRNADGDDVPVRVAALRLRQEGKVMGAAVIIQDLREIRQLEHEKLEAERLAAVGQTVAGLAHGIKNILTGLEGGMYVTSTGLKKGDDARVRQGWEMLERNIGRISALVKSLLAFSRGDTPKVTLTEPAAVIRDVVGLYRESAEHHGVSLLAEVSDSVAPAYMDPEGLHTCLANLVSNALDACLVSHNAACTITIRLAERNDAIVFEVTDSGCGMDYEVKQRAFTSFFTTKGSGGSGLGLLVTRKIVQQHGGTVTFESTPGEGTTFSLSFPRARLPKPPSGGTSDESSA